MVGGAGYHRPHMRARRDASRSFVKRATRLAAWTAVWGIPQPPEAKQDLTIKGIVAKPLGQKSKKATRHAAIDAQRPALLCSTRVVPRESV